MEPVYQGKSIFAVVPNHIATGAEYDIAIYPDKVALTYTKSLVPKSITNQFGLIGMLVNKLFSSTGSKEEFTFSLNDIKKMELSTSQMMGMKNKNLMFWNVDPKSATYENITFTLNLKQDEEKIKSAVNNLMQKVDFKEVTV